MTDTGACDRVGSWGSTEGVELRGMFRRSYGKEEGKAPVQKPVQRGAAGGQRTCSQRLRVWARGWATLGSYWP